MVFLIILLIRKCLRISVLTQKFREINSRNVRTKILTCRYIPCKKICSHTVDEKSAFSRIFWNFEISNINDFKIQLLYKADMTKKQKICKKTWGKIDETFTLWVYITVITTTHGTDKKDLVTLKAWLI